MKKRIISMLLVLTMLVGMVPVFGVNVGAFDISQLDGGALYHTSANFGRLMNNKNIFTAHYLGAGYSNESSIDSRLRNRSSSMVYEHIATIERENLGRVVFDALWSIASVDLERLSRVTEVELYTAVLWGMLTGQIDSKAPSVESTIEDFESVVLGANMELAEYLITQDVLEETTKDAKKVLEKLKIEDNDMLERVHIWYGDHYSSIGEEVENVKSAFKSVDEVVDIGKTIAKFCDSAYEYITKMNQIEVLYGESHIAYLEFLLQLSKTDSTTPLLKDAAKNLIALMSCSSYEDALKSNIINLVCQDGVELAIDKVSDVIKDTVEGLFDKAISNSIASSALAGIKIGMELADVLLGVNDKLAVRYNILLLSDMTNAIFDVSESLRKEYYVQLYESLSIYANSNSLDANLSLAADAYVASIEMCHRFLLQTNTYARQYINENYNDWWNQTPETFIVYKKVLDDEINALKTSYRNAKRLSDEYYWKFYEQVVNYIIFDADGWDNTPSPIVKEFLVNITIPDLVPTKSGYIFEYWVDYTNNQKYYPGDVFNKNYSDDVVLTPCFYQQDTIIYNANGGIGAPASHENTVGTTALSTKVPTRTGHTFLGWDENPNAKEPTYRKKNDGSAITIDKEGNVTLYAIWKAESFDIVFHANGGKFADNRDTYTMQKTYLKSFTVNPEIPTRDGYVFSGIWTLDSDDNVVHLTQGETKTDIDGKAGLHTRHFYAKWTKNQTHANFRYDYNNCSDYNDSTPPLNNGVLSVKLVDPPQNILDKFSAAGKKFVKWMYYKPDGSTEYYNSGDTLTVPNPGEATVCVYAIWEVASSGALLSVIPDKSSYLPDDTITLTITANNTGYFTVDASNGFKIKCADGSTASFGVFVEKSSASSSSTLKCYNNGSAYTVKVYIPNNCRDGSYTIDIVASNGTYGVSGTETNKVTETITITVNTSAEEVNNYAIIYDLNGGNGNTPDTVFFDEYDSVVLASDKTAGFKRDGYKFLGWAEKSNATSAKYKGNKEYQFGGSKTLYAVWKSMNTYLEFDIYNQDSTDSSKVYKPGDTIYIAVDIDNSDHFYINTSDCPGMKFEGPDSKLVTEGVFYEKSASRYDGQQVTYTNGTRVYIKAYIPNNCPDGTYQILGKAADDDINPDTWESFGTILSDSFSVHVKSNNSADAIYLNKSEMTVHVGDDKYVEAFLLPDYFNDNKKITRNIEWHSSNEKVATVDDSGKKVEVYGNKSGTATITATIDDVSASCKVTVVRCSHTVKDPQSKYLAFGATCGSQATYYYVCECGDVGTSTYKYGDVAAHNYSAWTIVKQPTEITAGVEQRTCSGCQNTEERSIPATGAHTTHTPRTVWRSDSEKHWQVCAVDGCTVKLNEGTHTFGELSVETPATETNTGIGYRTCTCGYSKSEIIPIIKYPVFIVQDAVVTSGDTVAVTISLKDNNDICAFLLRMKYNDCFVLDSKRSHVSEVSVDIVDNYAVICMLSLDVVPNGDLCTLYFKISDSIPDGQYIFAITEYEAVHNDTCELMECHIDNGIITIDRHIHTFSAWSKHSTTQHKRTCSCGEVEYADHTWDAGKVTTQLTYTMDGVKTYTCTACKATKTEKIPKLIPDVDIDGDVDEFDAKVVLQYVTGHDVEVKEESVDINGDGEVNIRDAAAILLYLKSLE